MRGRMVTLETTTPLEKLKMMVCKDYGVGHNVVNAKFSYLLLNQRGNSPIIINNDRQASNFVGYAKRDSSTTLCVTFSGAVIVSTPQNVALADANSGISMFDKVRVPILGLVENMSCFVCPHCNEAFFIFGKEGARQMAAKKDLKLIGEIPLEMKIREVSDEGVRVVVSSPGSVVSKAYEDLAQNVLNGPKELRDNPENEIQMKLNVSHSS
ncbi:hypothetical protein DY000_02059435 [Brassica cretica]|uniref:Uncharacterized protein n=1 Tax=Brassica cretica TaxID=69181 RepID=A0ABQ7AW02_BRACR|nr:hypothetical protein DY000_02059435 [Brassica cretica]